MSDDGDVDLSETRRWPPSGRQVRILFFLVVIAVIVVAAPPRGGWHGPALVALLVLLPVALLASIVGLFALAGRRAMLPAIVLATFAGALLHVTAPNGPGIALAAVGCALAGTHLRLRWAVVLTLSTSALAAGAQIAVSSWTDWGIVTVVSVLTGAMVVGRLRHQRTLLRREEELLAEEQDRAPRSPSEPGWPGRSTTCWRIRSRR